MEVTLEKIELVRDRTGVSYKEAKDALEAADGSVVDAIIAIEESVDGTVNTVGGVTREAAAKKDELVQKMKDVVKKGGVSKIRITRDGETILNIPLIAGILGTVVAPWGIIAGTVAAFGFKCKLEFVKEDGSVVDLSEKAGDVYETAREKGTGIYEELKEKAPANIDELRNRAQEVFNDFKENAPGTLDELKNRAQDTFNDLRENAPGSFDEIKTRAQDTINDIREKAPDAMDNLKEKAPGNFDEFKNKFDQLWEKGGDAITKAKETVSKPINSFKEGVQDVGDFDSALEDVDREMSQLEKDLIEMQKKAAEGIKEFEDEGK